MKSSPVAADVSPLISKPGRMEATIEILLTEMPDGFNYHVYLDGYLIEENAAAGAFAALRAAALFLTRKCKKCGCDLLHGCKDRPTMCHWVKPDLCSACVFQKKTPRKS